ncbi:CBS domain-containing protein [Nonomuraea helvata]|uniref:HPP family protein n=1 Tax=Nonomuraea helvata TaxID=37484 RepID=A0ABV5SB90_9ACTN
MLVREVMSSPAVTVRSTDPVRRAIRILYSHNIAAAPVLDGSDRLVGVVSELDLLRGEFEPDPRATVRPMPPAHEPPCRVMEVMTPQVITVTDDRRQHRHRPHGAQARQEPARAPRQTDRRHGEPPRPDGDAGPIGRGPA